MTSMADIRSVADIPRLQARLRPDAEAIWFEGRTTTFAQLDAAASRCANALLAQGLKPGDRVGVLAKNTDDFFPLWLGCVKARVTLAPVNWRLAPPEVAFILKDAGAKMLFVGEDFGGVVDMIMTDLPDVHGLVQFEPGHPRWPAFRDWIGAHPATDPMLPVDMDDDVIQLYTSGTTGLPKGVVIAHRSFFKVRDALASEELDWIDWREGDVSLVAVPGFHVGGLWWAMQGFSAGITNVAMRMFVSSDAVALIRRYGVTVTCMVPSMIQMCLAERGVGADDFASLRKVVYGGSPIAEALLERGLATMRCEFAQIYGLTETGNTAVCLPPSEHVPGSPRMQAAGRPYPGFRAKVIDRDGHELPPGEVGEVCLWTPSRMLAYWGLPEATAATLVDGWIHTGDAGFLDDGGFVHIRDRLKDMVIVAGEKVYPAEVENAIASIPAVAECAVIGVPDERWGEGIAAYVVLREGHALTPRELLKALKGRLADFKLPTQVLFIDRVPRNPSGKILRRELRDRHWQHMQRQVN